MSSYVSEATVPVSGGSRSSESSRSIIFWIKTLGKWCSGKRQLLGRRADTVWAICPFSPYIRSHRSTPEAHALIHISKPADSSKKASAQSSPSCTLGSKIRIRKFESAQSTHERIASPNGRLGIADQAISNSARLGAQSEAACK